MGKFLKRKEAFCSFVKKSLSMRGIRLFISVGLVSVMQIFGQDVHFSQFYAVPFTLNPAMTAFMPNCYRAGIAGRIQWPTFMKAYKTGAIFAEKKFLEGRVGSGSFIGGGLMFYHDRSGFSPFVINEAMLSGAFHKGLSDALFLSAGFSASYVSKTINTSELILPDQYVEGVGLDPNVPTSDKGIRQNVSYPDFSIGILSAGFLSYDFSFYAGVAVFHLLEPQEKFVSTSKEVFRYPRRFVIHGGVSYQANDFLRIIPNFAVFIQRGAKEIVAGANVEYSPSTLLFLSGGLMYRWDDAWILTAGVQYSGFTIGIAADFNIGRTGNVTPLTRGWAGLEVVLRYEGVCQKLVQLLETVPCPRL